VAGVGRGRLGACVVAARQRALFRQGSRLMAVAIEAGPGDQPRIGQPATLFDGTFEPNVSSGQANFDVGNPPRDFLMVQNVGRAIATLDGDSLYRVRGSE